MENDEALTPEAMRARLGFLGDPELAALLGIALGTLKNRRARGDSPPSAKIGRDHMTSIDDAKKWLARRRAARL